MVAGRQEIDFERFRNYLCLLARMHLDRRLRRKLDASDIVQQTLLQAYEARHDFRGTTCEEQAGWLRSILARTLAHASRDLMSQKRDIRREVSIDSTLADSSKRLDSWLQASGSSPSNRVLKQERLLELATLVAELPEDQQEVLVLHHCQGWQLDKIAAHMERTVPSVAGLLRRGLAKLRERLSGPELC
jgi:RNA polymerase sigma-70 factor (ECF subfamily)